RRAARVGPVEQQPGDTLGVPDRVGHAHRGPLRNAEQGERRLDPGRVHDRLQVLHPILEGHVAHGAVRHPASALVVAQEPEVPGEEADPMPPDRALPLVFEVGQPVRGLDHNGAGARFGPRETEAVPGAEIADPLSRPLLHVRLGARSGTLLPASGSGFYGFYWYTVRRRY